MISGGRIAVVLGLGACMLAGTAPRPASAGEDPQQRAVSAQASSSEPGRARSFEVSVAAHWLSGSTLGASTANLLANRLGGGDFLLFEAEGDLEPAAGVEARLGFNVTSSFAVEGGFAYSRPDVRVSIANDVEAEDVSFVGERLSQYVIDVSAVFLPPRLAFRQGRGRVFVAGGAGYLRQLHDGRSFVETGQVYHVGGGLKYLLRLSPRSRIRGLGVRVDARLNLRSGGFAFTERVRPYGSAGGGLYFAF